MKRKVFIRADGNSTTGLGHVVRSCALADMLKDDFDCHFFIRQPSPALQQLIRASCSIVHELPDQVTYEEEARDWSQSLTGEEIVVLDGYSFTTPYQQQLRSTGIKLVCIDDINEGHFVADVVINHAPGKSLSDHSVEPYTRVLLGTDYVLLRKPFLEAVPHKRNRQALRSLFICFGGADFNNLAGKSLDAAMQAGHFNTIHIVAGNAFQHKDALEQKMAAYSAGGNIAITLHHNIDAALLATLVSTCDVAICPCSSVLFEVCAVGAGLFSGYYVDNQQSIFEHLEEKGLFAAIGDFNVITIDNMAMIIGSMKVEEANQQIALQQRFIDGDSPNRLGSLFHKLDKEFAVQPRMVTAGDMKQLYEWANEPSTRANAIQSTAIPWEDHVKWFTKKLQDPDAFMFVFEQVTNGQLIGLVRFDRTGSEYLISFLVDKAHRHKGWGEIILKLGLETLKVRVGGAVRLKAMVKEGNVSSMQVFRNLGFRQAPGVELNNVIYNVYEKY